LVVVFRKKEKNKRKAYDRHCNLCSRIVTDTNCAHT